MLSAHGRAYLPGEQTLGPAPDPATSIASVLAAMTQSQTQAHGMTEGRPYVGPNLHEMFHEELQAPCIVTGGKQYILSPLLQAKASLTLAVLITHMQHHSETQWIPTAITREEISLRAFRRIAK